jgi:transcriptional regulator with XRE-family HTH domain
MLYQTDNIMDEKNGGPNYLRDWRDFRKLTQEDLAAMVDTSVSVISMLESGQRGLSAKWLRRLAPALQTTPGFLLEHNPYDLPNDILDIWNRAQPEQKEQIKALAETVIAFRRKDAS